MRLICNFIGSIFHLYFGQISENTVDVSLADEDRYPLVTDVTFVPTMHAEILKGPGQWATPKLYAAVEFAWGILLRECAGRAVFTGEGIHCGVLCSVLLLRLSGRVYLGRS